MNTLNSWVWKAVDRASSRKYEIQPFFWMSNVDQIGSQKLSKQIEIEDNRIIKKENVDIIDFNKYPVFITNIFRFLLQKRAVRPDFLHYPSKNTVLDSKLGIIDTIKVSSLLRKLITGKQIEKLVFSLDERFKCVSIDEIVNTILGPELSGYDSKLKIEQDIIKPIEKVLNDFSFQSSESKIRICNVISSLLEQSKRRGFTQEFSEFLADDVLKIYNSIKNSNNKLKDINDIPLAKDKNDLFKKVESISIDINQHRGLDLSNVFNKSKSKPANRNKFHKKSIHTSSILSQESILKNSSSLNASINYLIDINNISGDILFEENKKAFKLAFLLRVYLAYTTGLDSQHLVKVAKYLSKVDLKSSHKLFRGLISFNVPGSCMEYFNFLNSYHGIFIPNNISAEYSTLYKKYRPQKLIQLGRNKFNQKKSFLFNKSNANSNTDFAEFISKELSLIENLAKWNSIPFGDIRRVYKPDYWSDNFPIVGDILGDISSTDDIGFTMTNFTISASKGILPSQYKVGMILLEHYTFSALIHLKMSADQGYIPSLESLTQILSKDLPVYYENKLIGILPLNECAKSHYLQLLHRQKTLLNNDDTPFIARI